MEFSFFLECEKKVPRIIFVIESEEVAGRWRNLSTYRGASQFLPFTRYSSSSCASVNETLTYSRFELINSEFTNLIENQ
jgi:hypothetical protein